MDYYSANPPLINKVDGAKLRANYCLMLLLYHFEKRMLRIVRGIKIIFRRHPFDKKDDFQPKKWY
ncbi:MAG: hypothetical protein F6K34_13020 [Okeania sp. SIO4D6]|uniref:Uncharacterized protein n=1 Tax=Okeania hirsuta TaxID=1458930 RepID=A0A3N6NU19_9CYAN|nr:hypothetical protein [Okeania sp. SIO1F9]NEP05660.1 hypothetical protein [Okeania sp. SIO4D6]NEP91494.1 hypothetical protein [Okeania sp. SIO2F5]NET97475.1 hypothetical protein [Okeania sp. SIO1H2]RQH21579.1 hypothetical protein D5R40_31515 [Okeania hirsuta]NET76499.1 hypothetical protein [Okeania sp. SIO1F9]